MHVRDVMTKDVIVVGPEASLREVAAILAERGISGVPVVDDEGGVLGVVSEADIVAKERASELGRGGRLGWLFDQERALQLESKLAARTAGEAMSAPAFVVEANRPLSRAAAIMLDEEVNRLPVLENGRLVGIVTRADLVRAFVRSDHEIAREIRDEVLTRTLWIPPDTVEVEVAGGEVTLRGEVETGTEADLVQAFVQSGPGVISVTSPLTWRQDDQAQRLRIEAAPDRTEPQ
jgi:CBS domain-containing protein